MRKKLIQCLCFALMLLLPFGAFASVNGLYRGYSIANVRINGEIATPEVPAFVVDGRTMVPLRLVAENLGADVSWDKDSFTVNINTNTIINNVKSEREIYFANEIGLAAVKLIEPAMTVLSSAGTDEQKVRLLVGIYQLERAKKMLVDAPYPENLHSLRMDTLRWLDLFSSNAWSVWNIWLDYDAGLYQDASIKIKAMEKYTEYHKDLIKTNAALMWRDANFSQLGSKYGKPGSAEIGEDGFTAWLQNNMDRIKILPTGD